MFERFTEDSRRIVVAAQAEALALGAGAIEAAHMLIALAGHPAVATRWLAGLDRTRLRATLRGARGAGRRRGGEMPFAAETRALYEHAASSRRPVTPEHLLLALLEVLPDAGSLLRDAGVAGAVDVDGLRRAVAEAGAPGAEPGPSATGPDDADRPL